MTFRDPGAGLKRVLVANLAVAVSTVNVAEDEKSPRRPSTPGLVASGPTQSAATLSRIAHKS